MRIGLAAEGRGPVFASDRGRGDASNSLAPLCWHARGIATAQLARASLENERNYRLQFPKLSIR